MRRYDVRIKSLFTRSRLLPVPSRRGWSGVTTADRLDVLCIVTQSGAGEDDEIGALNTQINIYQHPPPITAFTNVKHRKEARK